jgi:hypothetical protein
VEPETLANSGVGEGGSEEKVPNEQWKHALVRCLWQAAVLPGTCQSRQRKQNRGSKSHIGEEGYSRTPCKDRARERASAEWA